MQLPIESLNLQMLNIGFAHHNSDWNWKNVNSPFTRIYLVVEGTAKVIINNEEQTLTPGHLYIIPAYTVHSYKCTGIFDHYYLHVYEGYKNETNILDFYEFPFEVKAIGDEEPIFKKILSDHPEATLPASDPSKYDNSTNFADFIKRYNEWPLSEKMRIRGCTLVLFSRFMEKAKPRIWTQNERMSRVLTYIHKHIYSDITINELAELACITKPYLIRLFNREFHTPPLQYIQKKKIERAQLLLLTEELSVKEISYKLGYNDNAYFTRLFKKITGYTPQAYRARQS